MGGGEPLQLGEDYNMTIPDQHAICGTASSRSGRTTVYTTEMGLPTAISIDRAELQRDSGELAQEILRLCRQASARARMTRRMEHASAGAPREVLDALGLPTGEDVALAEYNAECEYGYVTSRRAGSPDE